MWSLLMGLFMVADVYAHKVIVFAWVEDGMVFTESSFSAKKKAMNCPITVTDENENIIIQGTTDENGDYKFPVPEKVTTGLTVLLKAGPGHQATWFIPKDELKPAAGPQTEKAKPSAQPAKDKPVSNPHKKPTYSVSPFKVIGGIGIIFLVFAVIKRLKSAREKT